jgi:N-acetylneuraminic acid mutarotase
MKMIRLIAGLSGLCGLLFLPSCNHSTTSPILGNWISVADFKGHPRSGAYEFTIGNTAYVGLGYNVRGQTSTDQLDYRPESYAYDSDSAFWKEIAPFPGILREKPVAFSVNGKGYVGTGYNRDSIVAYLADFWQYDPVVNQWTRVPDFPGGERTNAVAFSDTKYGYVGTGFNGDFFADFWRFDPTDNSWKEMPDYPGHKRQQAVTMTISGKTYLMGGNNNGTNLYDIWLFNNETETWTNITPLTTDAQYTDFHAAVGRNDAVTFTLSDRGYITTGQIGTFLITTFQFDPVGLTWTQMTSYEGAARSQAVGFVVGGKAYLTTGVNTNTRYDNTEQFDPTQEYNVND